MGGESRVAPAAAGKGKGRLQKTEKNKGNSGQQKQQQQRTTTRKVSLYEMEKEPAFTPRGGKRPAVDVPPTTSNAKRYLSTASPPSGDPNPAPSKTALAADMIDFIQDDEPVAKPKIKRGPVLVVTAISGGNMSATVMDKLEALLEREVDRQNFLINHVERVASSVVIHVAEDNAAERLRGWLRLQTVLGRRFKIARRDQEEQHWPAFRMRVRVPPTLHGSPAALAQSIAARNNIQGPVGFVPKAVRAPDGSRVVTLLLNGAALQEMVELRRQAELSTDTYHARFWLRCRLTRLQGEYNHDATEAYLDAWPKDQA